MVKAVCGSFRIALLTP
nr:hypothetical protein [Shewanella algae]